MKPRLLLSFVVVLLSSCSSDQFSGALEPSPYYPTEIGSSWEYIDPNSDPKNPTTIVNEVVGHETVNGIGCAKIESRHINGQKVLGYEYITITKNGVYRVKLIDNNPPQENLASKPVLLLRLPPKKDDSWSVSGKGTQGSFSGSCKVQEETLTVPALKQQAYKVESNLHVFAKPLSATNYFVKDVGVAKIKLEVAGDERELVLVKYVIASNKPPVPK